MNLKKIVILKNVLDILTENEMKATRGGGYTLYVCLTAFHFDCVCGAYCDTDSQCEAWYGSGSTCRCLTCGQKI